MLYSKLTLTYRLILYIIKNDINPMWSLMQVSDVLRHRSMGSLEKPLGAFLLYDIDIEKE